MSGPTYCEVFSTAFGKPEATPYSYQCRLACGPDASPHDPASLSRGTTCQSLLIDIPTGLGKTAAVVLAWLWNRLLQPDKAARAQWPRRLVYCLPMRTLVEQTRENVRDWLTKLQLAERVGVHTLMGGEEAGEWDIYPEREAILIGTQDMLLSRALNRGYGASRARWPMHFGLLNNDCVWTLDETQLMGVGVRTSAQLEGLRKYFGTVIGCATWWASATLDTRLLVTCDHTVIPPALRLQETDYADGEVARRTGAIKHLSTLALRLTSDSAKPREIYLEQLAKEVLQRHQSGSTTIVILNRVDRAQGLYTQLQKLGKTQPLPPRLLVHSRFRPREREELGQHIRAAGEKIIIATQAIEAGVDISSRTLITELAPWSSLVQRFGRCNRKGESNESGGAEIYWIDLQAEDEKAAPGLALPYTPAQLDTARALLRQAEVTGAAPDTLSRLTVEEPLTESHLLRRKDLIELFDTTPDLAGLDIDVGRFIRDDEDRDVQLFWRELPPNEAPAEEIRPQRSELVRVPVHAFRRFVERNKPEKGKFGLWQWDVLEGGWMVLRPDGIGAGRVYLVEAALSGYSQVLGWTGENEKAPFPLLTLEDQPARVSPWDGQDRDDESQSARDQWLSIETHTEHVVEWCEEKLRLLPEVEPWREVLLTAARWHDAGKAHECFQEFISAGRNIPAELTGAYLAKAPWKAGSRSPRPHFRHELASALAWLQASGESNSPEVNLIAWLIATHHGKVRLTLRSMPGEKAPASCDGNPPLYARGVWQGDRLPARDGVPLLLDGFPRVGLVLDLSPMRMGEHDAQPSWAARALALRDSTALGPFRLTLLETIFRAADAIASASGGNEPAVCDLR